MALRLDQEIRAINQASSAKDARFQLRVDPLTASTVDDFRRALLNNQYDIVHFAGHADVGGLAFMGEGGGEVELPYNALAGMLRNQKTLGCVVLNACHSMEPLNEAFAPLVVGMISEIDDDAAIAFATGFYDAVAVGADADRAFEEGQTSMASRNFDQHQAVKLKQQPS